MSWFGSQKYKKPLYHHSGAFGFFCASVLDVNQNEFLNRRNHQWIKYFGL